MTDLEEKKFYEYLASFQDDIVRLIAYRRKSHHLMSVEEIVSDFNYNTIRKKEKIIGYRDERFKEFSFESFKFVVCSHIKNIINWYQCRKVEEKYHSRRVNHEIKTEEGVKTSFEVISETQGEDFDYSFDGNQKHRYFLNLIKNYSEHLTKNEVELLDYLLEGKKQKDIADEMGVTHQAISFNVLKLEEKLRCRVKEDFLTDESWENISKGYKAMEELFSHEKKR